MSDSINDATSKTTKELGNAIWDYHQSTWDDFESLLSDFLTAEKLELAIELLKLRELRRTSDDIEEMRLAVDVIVNYIAEISVSVAYLQH